MTSWLGRFLASSIGKKYVMAASGLALFLFLIAHLAGNLTLYVSDDAFNGYAAKLEANPLLPLAEAGLAALFLVHVVFAFLVIAKNRAARRVHYADKGGMGAKSLASTTMWITGPLVLLFLVIHIIDFKVPHLFEEGHDLAIAVRERLGSPLGAGIYFLSVVALGLHLWHAFQSAFQSVGVDHPRYRGLIRTVGRILAVAIFAGFASFPIVLLLS